MPSRVPLSPQAARLAQPAIREKIRATIAKRGVAMSDRDDLLQSTYMKLVLSEALPTDDEALLAFAYVATRSVCADYFRKRGRNEAVVDDGADVDGVLPGENPLDPAELAEMRALLDLIAKAEARGRVDPDVAVCARRLAEGHTWPEIAAEIGKSEAALKTKMSRARKVLAALVATAAVTIAFGTWKRDDIVAFFHGRTHDEYAIGPEPPAPPHKQGAALRDKAFDACKEGKWALCEDLLDEAAKIDPQGDADPRVQAARARAFEGQHPEGGLWRVK